VTMVANEMIKLRARDVFHLNGLGTDGLVGYDIVTLMANALGVGIAAQKYENMRSETYP